MSDSSFRRPGSPSEPSPEEWPYEPPQADPETPLDESDLSASQAEVGPTDSSDRSPTQPFRPPGHRPSRILIAGLVGLLLGGGIVGWMSTFLSREPEPIPITLDVFPEYIGNLPRPDLDPAMIGDPEAVEQFRLAFQDQRETYRFAYGADGATVDYGQFLLTIVNGSQSLPLPSDAEGSPGNASPVLISLDSDAISCTFRPEVGLYDSAVLQTPADLRAQGWTQCVLNDRDRHISLKLESRVTGRSARTSARFENILERVQRSLNS